MHLVTPCYTLYYATVLYCYTILTYCASMPPTTLLYFIATLSYYILLPYYTIILHYYTPLYTTLLHYITIQYPALYYYTTLPYCITTLHPVLQVWRILRQASTHVIVPAVFNRAVSHSTTPCSSCYSTVSHITVRYVMPYRPASPSYTALWPTMSNYST